MHQTRKNNIDKDRNPQETESVVQSDGVSPLFLEVDHTNLSNPPPNFPPPDGSESTVRDLFPIDR